MTPSTQQSGSVPTPPAAACGKTESTASTDRPASFASRWRLFFLVVRVLVTGILISVLAHRLDWRHLLTLGQRMQIAWVVAAVVAVLLSHLVCVRATHWLMGRGIHSPGYRHLLTSHFRGLFVAQFLPTALAADAYRVHDVHTPANPSLWKALALTLLAQRLAALLTSITLLFGTGVFVARDLVQPLSIPLIIASAILVIAVAMIRYRPRRLSLAVQSLFQTAFVKGASRRRQMSSLACLIAFSFVQTLFLVFAVWCLARGLRFNLSLLQSGFLVPASLLAVVLPISLNGLGVREAMYVFVMHRFGFASTDAIALALGVLTLGTFFAGIGGVVWLSRKSSRECNSQESLSATDCKTPRMFSSADSSTGSTPQPKAEQSQT